MHKLIYPFREEQNGSIVKKHPAGTIFIVRFFTEDKVATSIGWMNVETLNRVAIEEL